MFVTNWICLSCGDNISQNKQCKWDLKYLERSFFSLWSYVSSIVFTASSLLLSNSSVLLTFSSWIWQVLPSYEHSHILYELVVTMREHSTSLLTWIVKKRKKELSLFKSLHSHPQLIFSVPQCFNFFQGWLSLQIHVFFFNLTKREIKQHQLILSNWKLCQWTLLCWNPAIMSQKLKTFYLLRLVSRGKRKQSTTSHWQ